MYKLIVCTYMMSLRHAVVNGAQQLIRLIFEWICFSFRFQPWMMHSNG